ncbi:MAG: hypothetical protein Q7R57_10670 [Dehalococcoidales bacterium]|nr:hypothetical protein [Dehalococcoidales bacterium]
MVAKKPIRTIDFTDQDEGFIRQLSGDIGCFYCKASVRTYSLNKVDSAVNGEMGVFAWVHKESDDYFWITTRRVWMDEARTSAVAGGRASGMTCFPRDAQDGDSVFLDTRDGYQKTIRVLKLINKVR